MIVITDSNIIVSALINPAGLEFRILNEKSKIQFLAPEYMFTEIIEHWDIIVVNSKVNPKEVFL